DDKRIVIRKALPWTPAGRRARPKILLKRALRHSEAARPPRFVSASLNRAWWPCYGRRPREGDGERAQSSFWASQSPGKGGHRRYIRSGTCSGELLGISLHALPRRLLE